MANEINFDFAGAEAAGLSRQDIVREIEKSGKVKFDFTGARKAGISDDDIYTELSSRVTQVEEDIVAGPPEDEDLPEGDVLLGEMTAEEVPTNPNTIPTNTSSDQKTTEPSAPMFSQEGELTTGIASQMEANREQVMEQGQEQATVEGFANVVDPITGEKKQLTEGGITPDYPMLVGTKLGLFGGPGMMGEAALKTLATSEIPRGLEIAKGAFDNLIARGGLFKEFAETKGTLSKEAAYIIARHPNMTEDEMVQALTGVKTADQAYALSRMLGEPGYIKQAVRHEGDAASGMLRADLESGKEHIVNAIGEVDVARAKAQYGDMADTIAKDYTSVHNATPMLEDLDFLERFYGVTPSAGNRVVTQMKATLGQNPNINLSDALEFRADLNHLINKATRGREKVKLNAIKDNLDGFINSVATPEQKQIIDDAISNYSRTMQNRDVLDLVTKNTDDRGIAINWTKLHRDLNDANLRSPEAVDALRIAEAFSKRFGNDQQLLQAALPKGSSPDSGGVLGAWGYIINHLKDTLAIYGNRAENLKIQKAIMKSLKRGTTNLDFVNAMKADKDIPEDVIKIFEPLQIPYKAGARQTGDVNLEPIITPVGGTEAEVAEQVVPAKAIDNTGVQQAEETLMDMYIDGADSSEIRKAREVAETMKASANLPIEDSTAKALGEAIGGIHKNPTSYGRPYTLKFNDTYIPIEIDNIDKSVTVDTESFINGSGEGSKFYTKLWSTLNELGYKQDVVGLSVVNQLRLPINAFKFKQDGNKLPIDNTRFTELTTNAIGILNKELKRVNKKPIQNLTDEELVDIGATLGKDPEFRLNTNSLKLYRKAARLLGEGRALSVVALAPLINAAYEENED